jgi:STE24 endopeptidase
MWKHVKKFQEDLSAMNTDPWYSVYNYSQPRLVEKLQALEDLDTKK